MQHTNLSDIARDHAISRPTQVALICQDRRTTYAELNERINKVANGLCELGVKRRDRVAVLDHNSDQFYEIFLGAARAGAVLVPLNARLSAAEVAVILKDCTPHVLFVGPDHADMVVKLRPELPFISSVIVTGPEYEAWRRERTTHDPRTVSLPSEVCLQLYTSGTSGVPKGVQLTNENVLRPFQTGAHDVRSPWHVIRPHAVAMQSLPHAHVAGVGLSVGVIHAGGTVVVARDFVPPEIVAQIRRERVTATCMVPIMVQGLMLAAAADSGACVSLEMLWYAGAPMATSTLQQALAMFPNTEFGQLYGLTETTGPITYLSADDHRAIVNGDERLALSCGRPTPNVELRVIDMEGNALPPGQIGEVICSSPQVMKGYWNRPDENAAVLRNNWFHTGDLGSLDERGYLYLHDRKRDMIISGGENIYPAEVENALYGLPPVAEAAAFGVPDERWGEAVKAVVVLKPGQQATEADIVASLRGRLAGYKLPKSIDFADALPRNPTGKVLRRVLREPYWKERDRKVA